MNKQECDILNILMENSFTNQRALSEVSGHSLGIVNKSINALVSKGYLDEFNCLTEKAKVEFVNKKPKNAIILAAGFGMRMVPINLETPKGLLEVAGEPLIERIIKQLNEVGIYNIYIVVGFMKESYEYLIDEFGVELVVNEDYASKNNLHSIKMVADKLSNSYIIPCDIWCKRNPFRKNELYSWYMVSNLIDDESCVRVNRKMELMKVATPGGNAMIGISYLLEDAASIVRENIEEMCEDLYYDNVFWEEALYYKNKMIVPARIVSSSDVIEINTYEQLRELDNGSNNLKSDAINIIANVFRVNENEISDITVLKKGMTNRSFLFKCKNKKYIMRIPGEGTEFLINRKQEASVYEELKGKNISDNIVYINPETGYKITEFLDNVRNCNPEDSDDIKRCMRYLKKFHDLELSVKHDFDIFAKIDFYESLWNGKKSIYKDYTMTKKNVISLKSFINSHIEKKVLTHIDAVADNFLFVKDIDGKEMIRLIDWEYSGMQDPHVDIAMFCIYSLYNKLQIDNLIDYYFEGECSSETRIKIYCYIAACGLLWSNWCEYKRNLGIEFGKYSLQQYRYAKEYYRIVQDELKILEREK